MPVSIQRAVEDRGVLAMFGALAHEVVDAREDLLNAAARCRQKRTLKEAGEQRRTDPFTCDIGHYERPGIRTGLDYIEVIAAHLMRGLARPSRAEPSPVRQRARQQTLLNAARHPKFFLDLLLGALLLQKARIFQYGGGFDGERLQKFTVPAGQNDSAQARIHIKD